MKLVALDVALLPPVPVRSVAEELSAGLPAAESQGLRLDRTHLPHVTLTQQFIRDNELDAALERIDHVVATAPPLELRVSGGGKGRSAVWMELEPHAALIELHESLMNELRGFERPAGGPAAFFDHDARPGDVIWVSSYRLRSAYSEYRPHITLGHASAPPQIVPFVFTAATVAACHLGRFCSCRRVFREWTLRP